VIGLLGAALVAIVYGVPKGMLAIGARRAAACLEEIEAPRGPALPDCRRALGWFDLPARAPWTAGAARARVEEIEVRSALSAYADAAVGRPDRGALDRATGGIERAERAVAAGSRRVSFEDLGPSAPAPRLGREAARLGDRRTLVNLADRWGEWYVRAHALRAALAEGEVRRAAEMAERYAGWDPRDEDLRTTVAALLCLEGDAKRGMEMLVLTQEGRAKHRYAAMARNWGEVRALMVACAARAGVAPPPRPESAEAGEDDAVEVRTVLAARLAAAQGDAKRARQAAEAARDLLAATARRPEARLGLLVAALGAEGEGALGAAAVAELARAREDEGEPPLAPGPLLAADWLPAPGLDRPALPGADLVAGAERVAALAEVAELGEADRARLREAAVALAFEVARAYAAAGDAAAAVAVIDRLGAGAGELAAALGRSSAWALTGEPTRALDALDALERAGQLAGAPAALRAAVHLQRAELLAGLGRRPEAARAAQAADEAIAEAAPRPAPPGAPPAPHPHALLEARARWTRLALARPPAGTPLRPGVPAAMTATNDKDPFPWVGFADAAARWARPDQPALSVALARWDAARAAPPEARRAFRYAAMRRRGDAPPALAAYLLVGGELLGADEGDTEIWVDALIAVDARRFSYRQIALARAAAARWRGDAEAGAAWWRRYEALRAVATDPARAEIARYLGL